MVRVVPTSKATLQLRFVQGWVSSVPIFKDLAYALCIHPRQTVQGVENGLRVIGRCSISAYAQVEKS